MVYDMQKTESQTHHLITISVGFHFIYLNIRHFLDKL